MPGLPVDSPPAVIFTGQTTSGSPGLAIALEDGRAYGLGANPYGGYGVPSVGGGPVGGLSSPQLLPNTWGNASSFGMSFYYALFVVRADGSVMTSGYDGNGELGLGSAVGGSTLGPVASGGQPSPRPLASPGLSGLTALSASNVHALVIGPGNVVYAWGRGLRGALGDGIDGSSRTAPGMVSVP